mmetsp:Transcript_84271/g.212491  ORF Transcript_84271/g.212491 Transcript_84271/m.212491 type:complete len:314 (+) Transcript_84271:88-1029(+)
MDARRPKHRQSAKRPGNFLSGHACVRQKTLYLTRGTGARANPRPPALRAATLLCKGDLDHNLSGVVIVVEDRVGAQDLAVVDLHLHVSAARGAWYRLEAAVAVGLPHGLWSRRQDALRGRRGDIDGAVPLLVQVAHAEETQRASDVGPYNVLAHHGDGGLRVRWAVRWRQRHHVRSLGNLQPVRHGAVALGAARDILGEGHGVAARGQRWDLANQALVAGLARSAPDLLAAGVLEHQSRGGRGAAAGELQRDLPFAVSGHGSRHEVPHSRGLQVGQRTTGLAHGEAGSNSTNAGEHRGNKQGTREQIPKDQSP